MDILRNQKHATDRNWHWALDQYVSPKNSIKSCQKYIKVVEYWHGTIKNYRYDGDISGTWVGTTHHGAPPLLRWRRNATVATIIITAIFTNTSAIFTNISITFPLYLQRSTLLQPAVPST